MMKMNKLFQASLLLVFSLSDAQAFEIKKYKPHDVLFQMGFAMGAPFCRDLLFNWLAHDLIFDWAEAKLGEDIELEHNKKYFTSGADAAGQMKKDNPSGYCAELWRRFGSDGTQIPNLLSRRQ